MSEDRLRDDLTRAARARDLMADELLTEAFDKLHASYVAQWEATTVNEQLLREKYWLAARVVGVVRAHLMTVVQNGKVADAELKQINDLAERKKRWGVV